MKNNNKKISAYFQNFNFKLLFTLILINLLPSIYRIVRIFFLGDMPADLGLNIASQISWLRVLYEVMEEMLILPLFFIISKVKNNKEEFSNRIRTGLITTFFIFLLITVFIIIGVEPILVFMKQKKEIIEASVKYIRLETISTQVHVLFKFISITLIVLDKNVRLITLLGLQMLLTIISDTFLISSFPFSMQIGVNGIAIGNIIVNFILAIVGIIILKKEGFILSFKSKNIFSWQKDWFKVGWLSGLESLVRNAVFFLMVIRMINLVHEQGVYWVANNFIWGWLLLPILALGELIKKNSSDKNDNLNQSFKSYILITTGICLLWLITIPFWKYFLSNAMNIQNIDAIFNLVLILLVFYILFAFNHIVDSIFYGLGRTDLMLYQSLIVNSIFYGIMFYLYKKGVFIPTLNSIAVMFGSGIAIDSVITFIMFITLKRKSKLV